MYFFLCLQFIGLAYILTLGWLAVMAVAMIPVIIYASMTAICDEEIYDHTAEELKGYCFNITRFGKLPCLIISSASSFVFQLKKVVLSLHQNH